MVREVMMLLSGAQDRARVSRAMEAGGFRAVVPLDVRAWASSARPEVVLITDDGERAAVIRKVVAVAAPECASIILVHDPTPEKYRRLLGTCTSVLPLAAPEPDVICALNAAWHELACLPVSVLRGLTGNDGSRPTLPPREIGWLRRLAGGATVSSLAEIDELLATLDLHAPYPGAAAEGQRGRAGTPKRPALPDGWLDSRELGAAASCELAEAELDHSGG